MCKVHTISRMSNIVSNELALAVGDENNSSKSDSGSRRAELEQKFANLRSPQEVGSLLLTRRLTSSSKSVPRRTKSFVRYKISRSLNFDIGTFRHDVAYKSPNSSSDSSSYDEDRYLSRSAKIMRALNFTNKPSYCTTKMKKALSFDSRPSPKKSLFTNKDGRKAFSRNLNKSMLSETRGISSEEQSALDSVSSEVLATSSESIDENQNQTPSRQGTKNEHFLSCASPIVRTNKKVHNSSMIIPSLRIGLKEKIDDLVRITTPLNQQPLECKSHQANANNAAIATPRNLYRDFCEDEEGSRPCTPENTICIIPESMSAIKKSHRKERLQRRNECCSADLSEVAAKSPSLGTPKVSKSAAAGEIQASRIKHTRRSPTQFLNFVDQLCDDPYVEEKVAKSNICGELIHMESSTDYATDEENALDIGCKELSRSFKDGNSTNECKGGSNRGSLIGKAAVLSKLTVAMEKVEENLGTLERYNKSTVRHDLSAEIDSRPTTPEQSVLGGENSERTVTPENRINFLQQILRDSIKKSHKKVKHENKKSHFVPRVLHSTQIPDSQIGAVRAYDEGKSEEFLRRKAVMEADCANSENIDRASTPENLNSSRLLLSQFSSVKKSHKKNKHNQIMGGFIRRQKHFSKDYVSMKNFCVRNVDSLDTSQYDSEGEDPESEDHVEHSTGVDAEEGETRRCNMVAVQNDVGDSDRCVSKCIWANDLSPSKRKQSKDMELQSCSLKGVGNEEFRIFTPIKKRKPLCTQNEAEYSSCCKTSGREHDSSEINTKLSRCSTPLLLNCSEEYTHEYMQNSFRSEKNLDSGVQIEEGSCKRIVIRPDSHSPIPSGKLTPDNASSPKMCLATASIKKSHRKNKRQNGLQEQPISGTAPPPTNRRKKHNVKKMGKTEGSGQIDVDGSPHTTLVCRDSPESSNSQKNDVCVEDIDKWNVELLNRTPPDYFRAECYVRELQSGSIKRSHKKVRDQRNTISVVANDQVPSDDGSIFGNQDDIPSDKSTENDRETGNG